MSEQPSKSRMQMYFMSHKILHCRIAVSTIGRGKSVDAVCRSWCGTQYPFVMGRGAGSQPGGRRPQPARGCPSPPCLNWGQPCSLGPHASWLLVNHHFRYTHIPTTLVRGSSSSSAATYLVTTLSALTSALPCYTSAKLNGYVMLCLNQQQVPASC